MQKTKNYLEMVGNDIKRNMQRLQNQSQQQIDDLQTKINDIA